MALPAGDHAAAEGLASTIATAADGEEDAANGEQMSLAVRPAALDSHSVCAATVTRCRRFAAPPLSRGRPTCVRLRRPASDCVRLRQTASDCVRLRQTASDCVRCVRCVRCVDCVDSRQAASDCVGLRQTASGCVGLRQTASANAGSRKAASHETVLQRCGCGRSRLFGFECARAGPTVRSRETSP